MAYPDRKASFPGRSSTSSSPTSSPLHLVALCDTGSLHNRFAAWVADDIGLDVRDIEPEAIGVGGQHLVARTVTVALRIGEVEWEAPVSFCEPWPWGYQLLGQEGFFRWFEVVVRAADRELELIQIPA